MAVATGWGASALGLSGKVQALAASRCDYGA